MGDRANICMKEEDDKEVYLYTHWQGSDLPSILQDALKRGRGRWSDNQYLARIIFCEMVKDSVLDETGYGISAHCGDGGNRVLDIRGETVEVRGTAARWTFEEYLQLTQSQLSDLWES